MSSPRGQANPQSSLPFGEEAKPGFRTKDRGHETDSRRTRRDRSCRRKRGTGSLRVACAGPLCALARRRPADSAELVLAEVWRCVTRS